VCVRDGIRATTEPSSTALTESRSWLEARQLDDGHRLERQRRCGKNIHNYVPLNAVAAWIIDISRLPSIPRPVLVSLLHRFFARSVAGLLLGNSVVLEIGTRFHPRRPSYRWCSPYKFFYFRTLAHQDRPTDRHSGAKFATYRAAFCNVHSSLCN